MYIRKKKNTSGSISIQIIKKIKGKSKVIESIGCSKDPDKIERLLKKAHKRIKELEPTLFDSVKQEEQKLKFLPISNEQVIPIGDELFFGAIFDRIFNKKTIFQSVYKANDKHELFKALVISRILYPGSKLYLSDYLFYFKKKEISDEAIYRLVDSLYKDEVKQRIEEAVYKDTLAKVGGKIAVCFYDVTTLFFESESEDDLRRIGFSKEGKLARPQIQLGLFTTLQGYPLSYEVYHGKKYEGHTLLEALLNFQKKFKLKNKPIVVADRGMLNDANIAFLENNGYKYILGAKIKMLPSGIKDKIINLTFIDDNVTHEINIHKTITYKQDKQKHSLDISQRLILTYSSQRAKKDKYLREKALDKLKAKIEYSTNLTKNDLKLSHYAKYLDIVDDCKVEFRLNHNKVLQDSKLDGLKGYLTNDTTLSHKDIIEHYQNLWHIEKAFRISKTDLQIRPIHHRLEHRIKAHILISFVAYAIYKEFEIKTREIKKEYQISYKILRDLIKHVFAIKFDDGEIFPIKLSEVQQKFYDALHS
ncbi:IS1634 family transposase [Sulfurimonas sediminis]|uniref:IS1634 family transposase n=2 Tax=Sulfurimonas sediminis TaxID=2590020 RepID=A0A7M1B2I1_9BACT|nr:IS1634 family transposase [Sulfurimonas sediminis]QOP42747.1 IS1634 family transposase [Sulfurimonas sediminis]QOP43934.1 IS1634 family transposase [Sulfurimonas sediminis]